MNTIEQSIGVAATKIAKEIDANSIVSIESADPEKYEDTDELGIKVTIFKKVQPKSYKKIEYKTKTRKLEAGSVIPVKEILMEAITKDYIKKEKK